MSVRIEFTRRATLLYLTGAGIRSCRGLWAMLPRWRHQKAPVPLVRNGRSDVVVVMRASARRPAHLEPVRLPAFGRRVKAAALPAARARDQLLAVLIAVDQVLERLRRRVLWGRTTPDGRARCSHASLTSP